MKFVFSIFILACFGVALVQAQPYDTYTGQTVDEWLDPYHKDWQTGQPLNLPYQEPQKWPGRQPIPERGEEVLDWQNRQDQGRDPLDWQNRQDQGRDPLDWQERYRINLPERDSDAYCERLAMGDPEIESSCKKREEHLKEIVKETSAPQDIVDYCDEMSRREGSYANLEKCLRAELDKQKEE